MKADTRWISRVHLLVYKTAGKLGIYAYAASDSLASWQEILEAHLKTMCC